MFGYIVEAYIRCIMDTNVHVRTKKCTPSRHFVLLNAVMFIIVVVCYMQEVYNRPRKLLEIDRRRYLSIQPNRYDVIIVGAGLSGAVIAERHVARGDRVLVIDQRSHAGGNCYDYIDTETHIRVSKYGAHLFHTNLEHVWRYINRFATWRRWDHTVLAFLDGLYVPVPVNMNTINQLFNQSLSSQTEMDTWLAGAQLVYPNGPLNSEEMAKSRVGTVLYTKIFEPYTQKQWNRSARDLAAEVTGRIPVRNNFDNRYFSDKYQALPVDGYHNFVVRLLDGADVRLEVDYFDLDVSNFTGLTYYTGPIDRFFNYSERLEYRSLRFERMVVLNHAGTLQPSSVVNYPSLDYPFTRVIEYKHFLHQPSPHTVLFREYPSDHCEPYYPVPTQKNQDAYDRLRSRLVEHERVVFVGRLANYKYYNMDEAINNALQTFDQQMAQKAASLHVVTSVFNNDVSWMRTLCVLLPGRRVAWFVYDKNAVPIHVPIPDTLNGLSCVTVSIETIHLPDNVGREGHSWLSYMLSPERVGPVNLFLQGNPEADLRAAAEAAAKPQGFLALRATECGAGAYLILQDWGAAQLIRLCGIMGIDINRICYHFRGEFVADQAAIQTAVRNWGALMRDDILPELETGNDPQIGHALERLWVSLFNVPNISTTLNI